MATPRKRPAHAPRYPHASRELTPQEVRERYGHLIDGFLDAIRTDPGILVTLAEGAAMIDERRKAAQRTLQTKAKQKAERERAGAQ